MRQRESACRRGSLHQVDIVTGLRQVPEPDELAHVEQRGYARSESDEHPQVRPRMANRVWKKTVSRREREWSIRCNQLVEARFQWSHARDLKPEPDDLVKIEDKLKGGLPEEAADVAKAKRPGGG